MTFYQPATAQYIFNFIIGEQTQTGSLCGGDGIPVGTTIPVGIQVEDGHISIQLLQNDCVFSGTIGGNGDFEIPVSGTGGSGEGLEDKGCLDATGPDNCCSRVPSGILMTGHFDGNAITGGNIHGFSIPNEQDPDCAQVNGNCTGIPAY